ncbi:OLC1v1004220C1 [Oldenlandia corymbosa var. corymbosa]|uniref:OLC1v1004220C1 n=1 Tax=Oldenlandia corymbosa var. corymbosa TaxID=529605 RepID=A0AAV1DCG1_OLDCO|nr:OLC1v1004220C1 [Oldenlandia corymbosa var. corymbosa]
MADVASGIVIEFLLKTVISVAAEKMSLLAGKEEALTKLTEQLKTIKNLLMETHNKQIKTDIVQKWLEKLPPIILDAQIVFEELGYEVLRKKIENRKRDKARAFFSSSNPIAFNSTMTRKIKKVLQEVEDVYVEAGKLGIQPADLGNSSSHALQSVRMSTDPYIEHSEFVGRREDMERVINLLNNPSDERDLPIIAIHGMGGQGKTTLAQHIFNCDKVKSAFDKAIWICVSKDFDVNRLLIEMLPPETNLSHMNNIQALVDKLKRELGGKRLLLVLDNVWEHNREKWNLMKKYLLQIGGGGRGRSKILVTTREDDIVSEIGRGYAYRLDILSKEESWTLFEKYAFVAGGATKTPHLEAIGRRILDSCGGLPLAIRAISSLLRGKSASEWSMVEQSQTWNAHFEGEILPALKLSYDHLPTLSIKNCFAYCAIFEKNTILEKDRLIQLWMAQGLLDAGENLQMEDIGSNYFDTLIRSSLFQSAQKDRHNNITACKMHDLVHDLASQVSKGYCCHVKEWSTITDKIKAVHILIDFSKGENWKELKDYIPSKLRTLHIKGNGIQLFKDLSKQFPSLSVFIVDDIEATELPESIGDMKHLRVLDISLTSIRSLPNSFTKLYYLQTVRVDTLNEVPKGFGNLESLRHMWMRRPCPFPGLGKLKNLRTTPEFMFGKFEGCQIEELEHLDKLRGKLKLSNLDNVGGFESAAKSKLSKKCDIQTLELHWNMPREYHDDDIYVMEGLEPHPNLKVLMVSGYGSPVFPSWMEKGIDDWSSSMPNLVKLQLSSLHRCKKLPPLAHLPCLAYLEIGTLPNLEYIEAEFYGLSNVDWATKKSTGKGSNGSFIITLFPALKILKLLNMTSLIYWFEAADYIPEARESSVPVQARLCPCLEEIVLEDLPKLIDIPNLGSLQKLQVLDVSSCDNNLTSSWGERNQQGYGFPQQKFFPLLHRLRICNSDKLSAPMCNLIPGSAPIESLQIRCNPRFWPDDMYHLTSLKELHLGTRWKSDNLELDHFPWPYPTPNRFVSLTVLSLFGEGLPKVKSLPYQIQYLTSLTRLAIHEFTGLETLPEWLGDLECLVELGLFGCRNLKQLPEAFPCLISLQHLIIGYCPVLGNRCTHGSGSDLPKIAHVPYVDIFGNRE